VERLVPAHGPEGALALGADAHERRGDAPGPVHAPRVALDLGADVAGGEGVAHAPGRRADPRELAALHLHLQGAAVGAVERAGRQGNRGWHRVTVGLQSRPVRVVSFGSLNLDLAIRV